MINKNLVLSILLATSLFSGVQAKKTIPTKKEAITPKVKPYLPALAKALEISSTKPEGALLYELFDSCAALIEVDPRPTSKELVVITTNLAAMIKNPKASTLEEKAKVLEELCKWSDAITPQDQIATFNDKKSLEKAADLLVNHSWSLVGQQIATSCLFQRVLLETLVIAFGNAESLSLKDAKTAGEVIKRAHKHSVKEVTDALITLEKNIPVIMLEFIQITEQFNRKAFTFKRDFKEYQECAAYLPQPAENQVQA